MMGSRTWALEPGQAERLHSTQILLTTPTFPCPPDLGVSPATQERVGRTIGTRRVRWLLSGGQGLGGAASRRTWKTGKEWLAEES